MYLRSIYISPKKENRKGELHVKIESARVGVTEFTNHIDGMRSQRDDKMRAIEQAQADFMVRFWFACFIGFATQSL